MNDVRPGARDSTWDIARGIGMALVIYGHLMEPLYPARADLGRAFMDSAFVQWQLIYSFHMMLFFLVSGAVNRSLPKKAFPDVFRASLRLLALAWIVHILGCIVAMSLGFMPSPIATPWAAAVAVFDPIIEGFCWSVGVLWFLTALCFVQLLAWLLLRKFSAPTVILGAVVGTALLVYFNAPNQYLLRAWMPGLSFFALGYWLSVKQVKWPVWLFLPLAVAAIYLAPLNNGCAFTIDDACQQFGNPPNGVRMFGGAYGFLPMFFLSSLLGVLAIVSLSAAIARFRASELFAYMGRNSLELFVINGFVATFLPATFAGIPWPALTPLHYLGMFVAIVGAHLLVLVVLRRPLGWINAGSIAIAGFLSRPLSGERGLAANRPPA